MSKPTPFTASRDDAVPPTDADLARSAQRGEKRAFVEIVARHQAMVCGVALGILGDFAASEDAAQEVFVTAWRRIQDLREPDKLRAWLAQIARHTALGHLRRGRGCGRGQGRGSGCGVGGAAEELSDENQSAPDEHAASEEEASLVREALAKLPENYRLPLVLFYRQEQSVREVAVALGLSEDVVKQRLARGREMLRDRMAGLIETALRVTQPGAIFTMAIAAAIGALIAPAAVAGTAFAAATAASSATATAAASTATSTVTTTTTPVLTAMTTKATLATAALVAAACLPIGYAVNPGNSGPNAADGVPSPSVQVVSAPDAKADFAGSALFAEWRRLHDEHGHDAAAMPELFNVIAEVKDPFRRRAFRSALLAEWSQVDPEIGFDFLMAKNDGKLTRQLFATWLKRDPQAALAKLTAAGKRGDAIAREMLPDIARLAPEQVGAIAARLPKTDNSWTSPVGDAFAILAEKNLASARETAEALQGPMRQEALEGLAKAWAKKDAAAAMAWAKELPEGEDREAVLRSTLMGLAKTNPAQALENSGIVPPGGRPNYFADTTVARLLREVEEKDFDTVTDWIRDHPGKVSGDDVIGLSEIATRKLNEDPIGFLTGLQSRGTFEVMKAAVGSALLNGSVGQLRPMVDWLKTQPDNPRTQELRQTVIEHLNGQVDTALDFAKTIPATEQGDLEMKLLTDRISGDSRGVERFEEVLAKAPERLRASLLQSALGRLNQFYLDSPAIIAAWQARVAGFPVETRADATRTLTEAWAGQASDLTEVARWATGLPTARERDSAMAMLANQWVKKDSLAASEWIAQLPPGPVREAGAAAIVEEIAADSPAEAWQWATSGQNAGAMMELARKVVTAQAKRNPASARALIEGSVFSGAEKQSLQLLLEGDRGGK